MFYSQVILARKGPLGKIWLAAHFDKKLTKNQIFATDITSSVDSVLNPSSPLALRVSGHLMLGIVRIYARKVKYLMTDCTEAMWKIKLAFRPGNVDIDPNSAAALNIDDARYFGNISFENDYPDIENTAFPQFLLSGYEAGSVAQRSSLYSSDDQDLGYEFKELAIVAASPILGPKPGRIGSDGFDQGRSATEESKGSSSRHSRVSDIEIMRDERSLTMSQQHRVSISSLRSSVGGGVGSRGLSAAAMGFDDDVPAFNDDPDFQQDASFGGGSFGDDLETHRSSLALSHPGVGELLDLDAPYLDNPAELNAMDHGARGDSAVPKAGVLDEQTSRLISNQDNQMQQETADETKKRKIKRHRVLVRYSFYCIALNSAFNDCILYLIISQNLGFKMNATHFLQIDDRIELPNRIIKQVSSR